MHRGFHSKRTWVTILYGSWTLIAANVLLSAEPENNELALLKAFIQRPASVEKIIFEQVPPPGNNNSDKRAATRFEGSWDPSGFIITTFSPSGQQVQHGFHDNTPWGYTTTGIESISFYGTYTEELQKSVQATGGLAPREEVLREVLNCGIFLVKPESLHWHENNFTATVGGHPATGYLTNFNNRGLPENIYYSYVGSKSSYKIDLEYKGTNLPAYFPNMIQRSVLRTRKDSRNEVPPTRYLVRELLLSKNRLDPARFNPVTLHPTATLFYHSNAYWMKYQGTNWIPVFTADVKPPSLPLKRILFLFLVVASSLCVYLRYRKLGTQTHR